MSSVRFEGVSKQYSADVNSGGVFDVSFEIPEGQFTTLVGASGSGKTTILRLIAGFLQPTKGKIYFDNELVSDSSFSLPTNKRDLAMVFQSYALWPHMTVFDNVAFGLRVRKVAKTEMKKRVEEVLKLVGMESYGERRPGQLSGGQQQRVALARSLVLKPRLLLLDEPLSNLDAELRIQMREQLKELQRNTGVTFVYVTHDQEEALAMSDYLLVLEKGTLLQDGHPEKVYLQPTDVRVARFIGRAHTIKGTLKEITSDGFGKIELDHKGMSMCLNGTVPQGTHLTEGASACLVLRSEMFRIVSNDRDEKTDYGLLSGEILSTSFVGRENRLEVQLPTGDLVTVYDTARRKVSTGETIRLEFDPAGAIIIPQNTEEII